MAFNELSTDDQANVLESLALIAGAIQFGA
jgi:hypothetical protein